MSATSTAPEKTFRSYVPDNTTLPEFKCVEMTEELLYRDLNGRNAR